MRELDSYTVPQWLAFTPVVHRFKYLRNRTLERMYRSSGAATRERFLAASRHRLRRRLVATIAFNTPWVVELFLRAAQANLSETSVVVADNSSRRQARVEIAALCRAHGAAYVPLPRNPEWHPNRSHGIAMNWVYYNLIRPLDPDVFAFLDHDMFVLAPFDLAEKVARQPVYGWRKHNAEHTVWSLWAGYAIFDYGAIKGRKLDFNYDSPSGLDTGGYNWEQLYRYLDVGALAFAESRRVRLRDPRDMSLHRCLVIDSFAHVGGASYGLSGRQAGRIALFRQLVAHVEAGGSWQDFVAS